MRPRQLPFIALTALLSTTACAQYGAMQIPSQLNALTPRDVDQCPLPNSHNCLDVNNTASCCPNTHYCIINTNLSIGCCPLGSNCDITACATDSYICTTSISTTISGTATATPTQACCPRKCTASAQFLCPVSLGGNCCPYGYMCASGSGAAGCVSTASSTTAIVTAIASGCSVVGQTSCAASLGGGCCGSDQACVTSSGGNFCSVTGVMATRTGAAGIATAVVQNPQNSKGLSTGAKAGIGVGVSLGALAVFAAVMWFCLVHRRRRQSEGAGSVPNAMSEGNGRPVRPSPGRSQPSDYFGPEAGSGPFTEGGGDAMSPGSNSNRGVPATPQSPGDIASPVEIDSRGHSNVASPGVGVYNHHLKKAEETQNPVELP